MFDGRQQTIRDAVYTHFAERLKTPRRLFRQHGLAMPPALQTGLKNRLETVRSAIALAFEARPGADLDEVMTFVRTALEETTKRKGRLPRIL